MCRKYATVTEAWKPGTFKVSFMIVNDNHDGYGTPSHFVGRASRTYSTRAGADKAAKAWHGA